MEFITFKIEIRVRLNPKDVHFHVWKAKVDSCTYHYDSLNLLADLIGNYEAKNVIKDRNVRNSN